MKPNIHQPFEDIIILVSKKPCTLLLVLMSIQLLMLSCGKKTTPSPLSSGCKLVTILDTAGQSIYVTTLTYNSDGKLSGETYTYGGVEYRKDLTYKGNSIVIISQTAGSTAYKDSVILTPGGYIGTDYDFYTGNTAVITYSYDGSDHLIKSVKKINSNAADTTYYIYTNGDLTQYVNGGEVVNYTYMSIAASCTTVNDESHLIGKFVHNYRAPC